MAATIYSCRASVLFLLLCLSLAAQKPDEVEKRRPEAGAPRGQVLEWRSAEGKPYWYRLPEKGKESKALLVMLHGTGVPQGWAFWNYPIAAGSFRPGDIVVAPEGMTPGAGDSFNFVQNDADGDQLAGIIRGFTGAFEIDRVFVYGHSQGAFFSYWFAGRHPELIDGIVAHAGNLLGNVSHPPLAREKVAIAILHGRADAVVPVDCAVASEKALRELDYARVKLEIVEGLTAQSGHWPLPGPVAQLLDWLDQVSVADAGAAIQVLEGALAAERPQLADLITFGERATALVQRHRGADRKDLQARLEIARADLDAALDRVVAALAELDAKAGEDSATAALFRLSAAAIADRPMARKSLRAALAARKSESKEMTKAIDLLARKRDLKSLTATAKVLDRRFLAPERIELARLILRLVAEPVPDLDPGFGAELGQKAAAAIALEAAQSERLGELLRRPVAADR